MLTEGVTGCNCCYNVIVTNSYDDDVTGDNNIHSVQRVFLIYSLWVSNVNVGLWLFYYKPN